MSFYVVVLFLPLSSNDVSAKFLAVFSKEEQQLYIRKKKKFTRDLATNTHLLLLVKVLYIDGQNYREFDTLHQP
jgi:hypothetical protein